jgi:hypothetical protein
MISTCCSLIPLLKCQVLSVLDVEVVSSISGPSAPHTLTTPDMSSAVLIFTPMNKVEKAKLRLDARDIEVWCLDRKVAPR